MISEKQKQHVKNYFKSDKGKAAVKRANQKYLSTDLGKEFARKAWLKNGKKILASEYDLKFNSQNGLCAICNQPETKLNNAKTRVTKLAVDHNHTTGKIRDLLCSKCNTAIGLMKENTDIFLNAVKYLERHKLDAMSNSE